MDHKHTVQKYKMWVGVPPHDLFSVWSRVTMSCMNCRGVALRLSCSRWLRREPTGVSSPSASPSRFQLDCPLLTSCDGFVLLWWINHRLTDFGCGIKRALTLILLLYFLGDNNQIITLKLLAKNSSNWSCYELVQCLFLWLSGGSCEEVAPYQSAAYHRAELVQDSGALQPLPLLKGNNAFPIS